MARFFEMTNLPIPPASNNQYFPFVAKGSKFPRYVPTSQLKTFQKDCERWAKENFLIVGKSRQVCQNWLLKGNVIRIEIHFFFPHGQIWTKELKARRFDISNRIKALEDQISDMLCIDDSLFFFPGCVKWETTREEPWAHAVLSSFKPGGFEDFQKYMAGRRAENEEGGL